MKELREHLDAQVKRQNYSKVEQLHRIRILEEVPMELP